MAEGVEVQKHVDGRIAVLAWGMCVLALALILVSLVLTLLGTSRIVGLDFPLVGVSGALVGGLVASRKPRNPVGWFFLAAAASLVVRLVRSRGVERKQIEWFVFAAALVPLWFLVNAPVEQASPVLFRVLDALIIAGVPVAAGIAILRYRLYDIDRIINRTIVYAALTAVLVAVYFGAIVVSQQVLIFLTGQRSTLAVVVSTLVIAALFNPMRRRTQSFVDRRFYRSKYDARKTLESFSTKLREETDLGALNDELIWVVRETVQPAHISLWLRPEDAPQEAPQR